VALADTFDAIAHHRRYDAARSAPDAVAVIAAERGKQFDPELTDLFLSPAVQARVNAALAPATVATPPTKRMLVPASADVPDVAFRWRTAPA
jgi:hypothetical protein